jgi:hypothetical protein
MLNTPSSVQQCSSSRQRRLAGTGQAEEDADVAVWTLVGRAVHRQHAVLGHQVVHDREHALLHLTGVFGTEDHELATRQAEADAGRRLDAIQHRVGREAAGVVDHVVGRTEVGQLLGSRADQHVAHEQRVVGTLADDAHLDAVVLVPAGEAVDHVELVAGAEVVDSAATRDVEHPVLQADVDITPPDVVEHLFMTHDALVLRTAPGLGPGQRDQRTGRRNCGAGLVAQRFLVEKGGRRVAQDTANGDAVGLEAERLHEDDPG